MTTDLSLILNHPSDSKLLLINVVIYLKSSDDSYGKVLQKSKLTYISVRVLAHTEA